MSSPRIWALNAFNHLRRSSATSPSIVMTAGLSSLANRTLAQLRVPCASATCGSPKILPSDLPIEEETIPNYNPEDFYPVNPGDIFHNRYETIAKVGWGSCSTVWLARDLHRWRWQRNRYIVLKINNCDFFDKESAVHELNISQHLAKANSLHKGFSLVRTIVDSFEAVSPYGTHICLVYEPMREPLSLFQRRFSDGKIPLVLIKAYFRILLMGLDYLHSQCYIVHTDLKLDNLMVDIEDPSVLEDFVQAQAENPMPRKIKNGRTIYQSHNDFGPLRSLYTLPKIADFGLAQRSTPQPQIHPIQPDHYRAPEVILGAGWTYSADIWNFGLLVWNLVEKRDLFRQINSPGGIYNPHAHLAEMIALLGPPPKELLKREEEGCRLKWRPVIQNAEGKLCESAREYYGGPFFDSEGEFIRKDIILSNLNLEDSVSALEGEEKRLFLSFVSKMLQWLPEDRKTAKELLEDPWLG